MSLVLFSEAKSEATSNCLLTRIEVVLTEVKTGVLIGVEVTVGGTGVKGSAWGVGGAKWGRVRWGGGGSLRGSGGQPWGPNKPCGGGGGGEGESSSSTARPICLKI